MTKTKRLLISLGLCLIILTGMFAFTACDKKQVNVTIGYNLYKYDAEKQEIIRPRLNKDNKQPISIECFNRYAISFTIEADADIEMKLVFTLPYVDTEATKEHLAKSKEDNLDFRYILSGDQDKDASVYEVFVDYKVKKKEEISTNSDSSFLIIGVDNLPRETNADENKHVNIEIAVEEIKKNDKDENKYDIRINNSTSNKASLGIGVVKGNFAFTKSDNVIERVGAVKRMTYDVICPERCTTGVKIAFYRDDGNGNKNGFYGEVKVEKSEFVAGDGIVTVNMGEMFSQFVINYDEGKYVGYNVIVQVTALGDSNTNPATVEFAYEIKE